MADQEVDNDKRTIELEIVRFPHNANDLFNRQTVELGNFIIIWCWNEVGWELQIKNIKNISPKTVLQLRLVRDRTHGLCLHGQGLR